MVIIDVENKFCHTKWLILHCFYMAQVTLRTRPSKLLVKIQSHFNYFVLKGKKHFRPGASGGVVDGPPSDSAAGGGLRLISGN